MSTHDTTVDERLAEHATYLAKALAETTADSDDATPEQLETVAHLWLMGSYRKSTPTRHRYDVDLLLNLNLPDAGDGNSDEILRRVRNLWTHRDLDVSEERTSVRLRCTARKVDIDVMPVVWHTEPRPQPRSDCDWSRQLIKLLKWNVAHEKSAAGDAEDQDELRDRCPRALQIEVALLLLAATAPEVAGADEHCPNGAWRVEATQPRCSAAPETVVLYVPHLSDAQVVRAWQVARDRYQQTEEKVRLLESSSLGTARSRSARRRTTPGAAREVLKRVRTAPQQQ